MRVVDCRILYNRKIAKDTYKISLQWDNMPKIRPGQFVNVAVENNFLRRPISISQVKRKEGIVLVYKIVGEGTKKLSQLAENQTINLMGPLGNGYELSDEREVLIICGGAGVPPLLELAKQYVEIGSKVNVVLGFTDAESVFYEEEFADMGCRVYVATDDGSYGFKGTALDCIKHKKITSNFVCSCGPQSMLKAVEKIYSHGFLSFESRMACGIGVCMACVAKDKIEENMYHRICKEGPVFRIGQIEF